MQIAAAAIRKSVPVINPASSPSRKAAVSAVSSLIMLRCGGINPPMPSLSAADSLWKGGVNIHPSLLP